MYQQRKDQPSFRVIMPKENTVSAANIKGKIYKEILDKVHRITMHQKLNGIDMGIKGFIFHGDVGNGKTTTAKALASELGAPLIFVDGKDIARPLYGQSEAQIDQVFKKAEDFSYAVILIDDCESVFPTRDWAKGEAWHFAQNNVFFHCLDNIDTSQMTVILTTNRYDLLDKAVIDRLYNVEFPTPPADVMVEIATFKCGQLHMDSNKVLNAIKKGKLKTVRDIEKFIMEAYIEKIART